MVDVNIESSIPITITEAATQKINALLKCKENIGQRLRVYITGGGCSGFQYGFTLDKNHAKDDTIVTNNGAEILIDSLSYQYLIGAKIDYKTSLDGSRFFVQNPNATTTCGCGSSFTI